MMNERRHRAYLEKCNAEIDRVAGDVLRELRFVWAFLCGWECRWCHRPVEQDAKYPWDWSCFCKHCELSVRSEYFIRRAGERFDGNLRAFRERAA